MNKRYNHMFTIAFEVLSEREDAEDVTPADLRQALLRRIKDLGESDEWLEATGCPDDTYELSEEEQKEANK